MSTNSSVDKLQRRQTPASTNSSVDKLQRRQTPASTNSSVDKLQRRQTPASTSSSTLSSNHTLEVNLSNLRRCVQQPDCTELKGWERPVQDLAFNLQHEKMDRKTASSKSLSNYLLSAIMSCFFYM
ncbi:uncharacterized protein BKA55DRAFT_215357 [Fusarium redolens]|uniref:Uncharacterized protein n=1 Tax=Fusarium redolens TaxID=48865 RepID=A0A9P9G072_FUSRE|nr:uncharacterized protein BKA55DRAFT_215357 [Fusarium redolens]KAH7222585.1 hypothetical protein BKA55DRAFT_215357 [Fusarium redolens]